MVLQQRAAGLEPDAVRSLFRERGEGLDLLRQLERGELELDEFSRRFGPLLGVTEVYAVGGAQAIAVFGFSPS